jgi:predicted ArsR family transcriptional regulator
MNCPCCGRRYPTVFAKILDAFEAEQIIAQYQLSKKLGVSKRQILRVLHQLEAAHYIERDHTEPSSKNGKDKIFWRRVQGEASL